MTVVNGGGYGGCSGGGGGRDDEKQTTLWKLSVWMCDVYAWHNVHFKIYSLPKTNFTWLFHISCCSNKTKESMINSFKF